MRLRGGNAKSFMAALLLFSTVVQLSTSVTSAEPTGGALPPPLFLEVQIAGLYGIPIDAVGVALNVTVTNPAVAGYVTVYPCGDRPLASNLNFVADQTVPNFVISGLSIDGSICVSTIAVTDLVLDLAGFIPTGSALVPLTAPVRFLDTREARGVPGRVRAGSINEVQTAGTSEIPPSADLVVFNATAVDASSPGFLTVFPCGQPIPPTSNLNFVAGEIVPNLVITRVGAGGKVCFFASADVDVVGDIAAYALPGATGITTLDTPRRVLDTRIGIGGPVGSLTSAGRSVHVGAPAGATAVIANLTAVNGSAAGFVTAYPCGAAAPIVSNVNYVAAMPIANSAVVKLDDNGDLCLVTNQSADLVVDVSGYATGTTEYTPISPTRIYDSRQGIDPPCQRGVRFNGGQLEIVDLRTGNVTATTTGLSGVVRSSGPSSVDSAALLSRDCKHVYVSGLSSGQTYSVALDGSIVQSWGPSNLARPDIVTNGGLLAIQRGQPALWLVASDTQQSLFQIPSELPVQLPTGGTVETWKAVGATADGSMFALSRLTDPSTPLFDLSPHTIVLFNSFGDELASWPAPAGAYQFALSPDGTYISYNWVNHGWQVVSADTGQFIAQLPGYDSGQIRPFQGTSIVGWITDGSVLVCAGDFNRALPTTALRWDLFSPVKPLVPSNPAIPCLLDAS
jgi:hypothetical protein